MAVLFTLLIVLLVDFGVACLLTWAITFIAGLLGITLLFSWKFALAVWAIILVVRAIFK